jgi:hypothetical protein
VTIPEGCKIGHRATDYNAVLVDPYQRKLKLCDVTVELRYYFLDASRHQFIVGIKEKNKWRSCVFQAKKARGSGTPICDSIGGYSFAIDHLPRRVR